MSDDNDCVKIGPTAKLTAYGLSRSDVPYTKEISRLVGGEECARGILTAIFDLDMPFVAALTEIRYKAIDREIKRLGTKNVLEIAAGILPRGLIISSDPSRKYVATDLPEMISESEQVIRRIGGEGRKNLFFRAVDAFDYNQLNDAVKVFEGEPFVLCNSGLLMYFDIQGRNPIISNVRRVMAENNGVAWVSSDFIDNVARGKAMDKFTPAERAVRVECHRRIKEITGRQLVFFDSPEQARAAAVDAGLSYDSSPLYDGSYKITGLGGECSPRYRGAAEYSFKQFNVAVMSPIE